MLRVSWLLAWLGLALAVRDVSLKEQILTDEDPLEKIANLVIPHGYPLQVYNVQADDGFILTLLRIPHGPATSASAAHDSDRDSAGSFRGGSGRGATRCSDIAAAKDDDRRPVVFLQHGLLDSAAGFLVNGPGRSLAFLLVDQGYDVWLGNVRGNSLSRAHASLDPSSERFWQWSYDEMAAYDLPVMIDFALRTTGAASVRYVGHSQGTTVVLAALSGRALDPAARRAAAEEGAGDVAARDGDLLPGIGRGGSGGSAAALAPGLIERAVLLAPVAVAKHISSVPLMALAALGTDDMFTLLGLHEFLPSQELVAALEGRLCAVQPYLCVSFLAALCGYNPANLDNGRIPLYLRYTPAGTSVQNMAHWAQAMRSRAPNTMRFFDYGTDCSSVSGRCNQLMYGSLDAPRYNLSSITTPLALFTGSRDRLAAPLDVEYLLESLAPGVVQLVRNLPDYEHLDFIWGIDAKEALYDDVLRFLAGADEQH